MAISKEFLFTAEFWKFAWERAATTMGETALATLGISSTQQGVDLLNLDLPHIISVALGAGIVSLGFSIKAFKAKK
jgi:Putative lactococcus lactis phage r1t holin